MHTKDHKDLQNLLLMILACSIGLLSLHFYYFCYAAFHDWRLTHAFTDRMLVNIGRSFLFDHIFINKLCSLLLLLIYIVATGGSSDSAISLKKCRKPIAYGLLCYFFNDWLLQVDNTTWAAALYMASTTIGYMLLYHGCMILAAALHLSFGQSDPFGRAQAGFPQEERCIQTEFSINLPAQYKYSNRKRNSWINIINSRRGILIMGSPGCGKSWYIIEPIIYQMIQKQFALFIFDFKHPTLTQFAWRHFQQHKSTYPEGTTFHYINFSDLSHSHRCNILHPFTLREISDAIGASRTIMLSMNKTWVNKQGEFFVESPINFLAAIIWFLRKCKQGRYCTLPHAIEMAQVTYELLFKVLSTEPDILVLLTPFVEAFKNANWKLLDSQVSSARIPLGRISSPEIYYILTGHDFDLDINNPKSPGIFCLGGDPAHQESLAPVISLYIDRLTRIVNKPGKYKCALICDEFATVRAYSMSGTLSTGRSNNIVPVLAIQDLNQLRTQYSKDEADLFLNISGSLLCGQVGGETARWVSERFPKILQDRSSYTTNSKDTSTSHSRQWEPSVTTATIGALSSGEFLGIVADDPTNPLELKAFHAKIQKPSIPVSTQEESIPLVREIDAEHIQNNFIQVKTDIINLVKEILASIILPPES